jgi:ATP-dependent 26S proteasome regulatory subunit
MSKSESARNGSISAVRDTVRIFAVSAARSMYASNLYLNNLVRFTEQMEGADIASVSDGSGPVLLHAVVY